MDGLGADEGRMNALELQRVVDLLNRELYGLLKLNLWFRRQVASDKSLQEFLDSFLQFRSRWYDVPHRGTKELSNRVFFTTPQTLFNRGDEGIKLVTEAICYDTQGMPEEPLGAHPSYLC
ncbi:unnamed protein product [Malus baccata var. baccata]